MKTKGSVPKIQKIPSKAKSKIASFEQRSYCIPTDTLYDLFNTSLLVWLLLWQVISYFMGIVKEIFTMVFSFVFPFIHHLFPFYKLCCTTHAPLPTPAICYVPEILD